ncbi:P-loop containing nucleoside triphosphate hydrolase protein [Saitoella complicata NRRL Y-17804]|nr:P-loop containing nucleoside triphosphate hydrolase protein [Saitoella complicata NRRL Y-17804]ODQ51680.1 P-loop containing nucleoside triphosphate hydrolase protein [Saitoella complicata NRRL Y-17804]
MSAPPPPPSFPSHIPPPPSASSTNPPPPAPPPPSILTDDPPAAPAPNATSDSTFTRAPAPIPKRAPLSIEEIMREKREQEAAASKPKFLTKEQRAALALEKRAKEVEEKRRKQDEERRAREQLFNGGSGRQSDGYDAYRDGSNASMYAAPPTAPPTGPRHMQGRIPNGPAAYRTGNSMNAPGNMAPPSTIPVKRPAVNDAPAPGEDKEFEDIRARYMGNQEQKKKKRRVAGKFTFDWSAEDDTSDTRNDMYSTKQDTLMFGRGRLGGFEKGEVEGRKVNWDNKHWSEKPLDAMKERDWRIFKEDFNIAVRGGGIPNPIRNWQEAGLPKQVLKVINQVGYKDPSPIQRAAIPIGLQSRDLIGIAETGSGKTAAFIIPLLVYISSLPPITPQNASDGPYAIVLAPTRELAQQIEVEAKKFAQPMGYTVVSIVGGHSLEEQSFNLRNGAEIVIATPGRLLDCLERRVLVLSQCTYIVMDEADRMIDMGFEEAVNGLLDALPVHNMKPDTDDAENSQLMSMMLGGKERYRQTVMFSATMPPAVERLARKYLRRPAIVTIGNAGQIVDTVEQRVEMISPSEEKRRRRLEEILNSNQYQPPVIIFVNQKKNCDALAKSLVRVGWNAVTMHGGKSQEQRESALLQLRNGQADCLVATDLAGRGIDVPNVSLVVNFNMAKTIEDYTHRIGRTGRAGKSGVAITFVGPDDTDIYYDLKQALLKSSKSSIPDELRRHEAASSKPNRSAPKKPTGDESTGTSMRWA